MNALGHAADARRLYHHMVNGGSAPNPERIGRIIETIEQLEYQLYTTQTKLREALRPFAHAGLRCHHYDSPKADMPLYALDNFGTSWELIASGDPVNNPSEQLTVQHLLNAWKVYNE